MNESINPLPGEILKKDYLRRYHISVTRAAKELGISRQALDAFIHGRSDLSVEMAIRLSIAFETTPEFWLMHQNRIDVQRIHAKSTFNVTPRFWENQTSTDER